MVPEAAAVAVLVLGWGGGGRGEGERAPVAALHRTLDAPVRVIVPERGAQVVRVRFAASGIAVGAAHKFVKMRSSSRKLPW